MLYAVDHAWKQPTRVLAVQNGTRTRIELKKEEEQAAFLSVIAPGDRIITTSFGTVMPFAYACMQHGADVQGIPSSRLKEQRESLGLEDDAEVLLRSWQSSPELFYPYRQRNTSISRVRNLIHLFYLIQKGFRISMIQRFEGWTQGMVLLEGGLEFNFKRNFLQMLQRFVTDERAHAFESIFNLRDERELEKLIKKELQGIPIYEQLIGIPGLGTLILARVISEISDIRRFQTFSDLKSYAGYGMKQVKGEDRAPIRAVMNFMREEAKKSHKPVPETSYAANWNGFLQQGIWLFTGMVEKQQPTKEDWEALLQVHGGWRQVEEQMDDILAQNKDFTRYKMLLMIYKARDKESHPEPVDVHNYPGGQHQKYTPIHMRVRANRFIGQQFLRQVWDTWRRLEGMEAER